MSIQFLRARWNLSKMSEASVRKPSADMARTVAISRVKRAIGKLCQR